MDIKGHWPSEIRMLRLLTSTSEKAHQQRAIFFGAGFEKYVKHGIGSTDPLRSALGATLAVANETDDQREDKPLRLSLTHRTEGGAGPAVGWLVGTCVVCGLRCRNSVPRCGRGRK